MSHFPKRCTVCSAVYTHLTWAELAYVGVFVLEALDDRSVLESRNCPCGSTLVLMRNDPLLPATLEALAKANPDVAALLREHHVMIDLLLETQTALTEAKEAIRKDGLSRAAMLRSNAAYGKGEVRDINFRSAYPAELAAKKDPTP